MNIVCTGDGNFIEVQGTAEGKPFDRSLLNSLLDLGAAGCLQLSKLQAQALA
jgi:ribonuclease PH